MISDFRSLYICACRIAFVCCSSWFLAFGFLWTSFGSMEFLAQHAWLLSHSPSRMETDLNQVGCDRNCLRGCIFCGADEWYCFASCEPCPFPFLRRPLYCCPSSAWIMRPILAIRGVPCPLSGYGTRHRFQPQFIRSSFSLSLFEKGSSRHLYGVCPFRLALRCRLSAQPWLCGTCACSSSSRSPSRAGVSVMTVILRGKELFVLVFSGDVLPLQVDEDGCVKTSFRPEKPIG